MLRSGSTSVLGRAYGVDEVLPLLVPVSSGGGEVDRLATPAARRRGGGGGGENPAGLRLSTRAGGCGGREGAGGGQLVV